MYVRSRVSVKIIRQQIYVTLQLLSKPFTIESEETEKYYECFKYGA